MFVADRILSNMIQHDSTRSNMVSKRENIWSQNNVWVCLIAKHFPFGQCFGGRFMPNAIRLILYLNTSTKIWLIQKGFIFSSINDFNHILQRTVALADFRYFENEVLYLPCHDTRQTTPGTQNIPED